MKAVVYTSALTLELLDVDGPMTIKTVLLP